MTQIKDNEDWPDDLSMSNPWQFEEDPEELDLDNEDPTRHFTERYWAATLVTAFLFGLSYYLLVHVLDNQERYVSQINSIGKENIYIQEIAKQVLLLRNCRETKYCHRQLANLRRKTEAYQRLQQQIFENDVRIRGKSSRQDALDSLFQESKVLFSQITEAAHTVARVKEEQLEKAGTVGLDPSSSTFLNISVSKILVKEGELSRLLINMASLYKQEAQAHIARIKRYQGIVLGIALLVLFLEALFLFPPIVRKLKSYVGDLQRIHGSTKQKNKILSEAYQQLKVVEKVTRLNAEALKKTNRDLLRTQDKLTLAHKELKEKNQELEETHDVFEINKQLEAARFFDAAINHFSDVMRWKTNQNIYTWTDELLAELVPYVNGMQAIIYVYDAEKESLQMTGSYASEDAILMDKIEVKLGDTLVGQAAKSLNPIYLENANGQMKVFRTHSGTLELNPQSLFILPLIYNNGIAGVLELTCDQKMEERHLELLKRMAENIGSHLSTLQDQKRINQLFADSQMTQKRLKRSLLRIQDNEERFRKLSEVTQEGLIFLEGNEVRDANSVLVKMMGYEKTRDIWGRHYIDFIAPKYRFEIVDKGMLDDGLSHESVAIKNNGETFPIEIQARKVLYNADEMTVLSIRDITEKKRTQKQLEEANRIASLVTELEKKNKDITSSIEYAQRIQEAILPSDKLLGKGFLEHFVLYIPKDIVSGDFYWFAEKNEHALIAAVDCTGHGVPGAFMSIIGYSNLNKIVIEQGTTEPASILRQLDQEVTEVLRQREDESRSRDGMDLALCSLNIFEKKLRFAGAYRPLYLVRKGKLIEHKGNPYPIGGTFKYKKPKHYTSKEIELVEGDTLYLFSDGFPDQFGGPSNRKYMTKNFKRLLLEVQRKPLAQQKEIIYQAFLDWKGEHKQMDDILIIGLRF